MPALAGARGSLVVVSAELRVRLERAAAAQLGTYSYDDRRVLRLLLLPFLILATALAINHGWRATQAFLPELVERAPVRPGPRVALEFPLPKLDTRIAAPAIRLPALPGDYQLPGPLLARSGEEASDRDRLAAVFPPAGLRWPPLPPVGLEADPSSAHLCKPEGQARVYAWSPRTSRAPLGGPLAGESGGVDFGTRLALAARAQTKDLVVYSARYQSIAYPLGDVHEIYGACTDVVIRAFRALGVDLQQLVQTHHAGSGDRNIDHRRTETLRRLFTRMGAALPVSDFPEDYKPGDVVTYHRPFSRVSNAHIAIVSDVLAPSGRPMIVHNRGWGPQLEDALFVDRITGHYRLVLPITAEAAVAQGPTAMPGGRLAGRAAARVRRTMAAGRRAERLTH